MPQIKNDYYCFDKNYRYWPWCIKAEKKCKQPRDV